MASDPNRDRSRCERYLARCLGDDVRLVQATIQHNGSHARLNSGTPRTIVRP